jgi:hypothetical protein
MNPATHPIGWLLAALACLGCRDLDRFDTRNGETYCGSLVGQGDISTGFEEPGWVGTSNKPTLSLSLNTSDLFRKAGVPAMITSNDAAFGPCAPDRPLFDKAKVRTIPKSLGDRLSSMSLGEDHEQDVATFVDSTCSGSMLGILSLIQSGDVELRLLRPVPEWSGDAPAPPEATARFGLFALAKTKSGCGF